MSTVTSNGSARCTTKSGRSFLFRFIASELAKIQRSITVSYGPLTPEILGALNQCPASQPHVWEGILTIPSSSHGLLSDCTRVSAFHRHPSFMHTVCFWVHNAASRHSGSFGTFGDRAVARYRMAHPIDYIVTLGSTPSLAERITWITLFISCGSIGEKGFVPRESGCGLPRPALIHFSAASTFTY